MGLARRPRFAWKKRSNIFTFLLVFVFLFQYFLQIYNLSSGQVLAQDSEEVQQTETVQQEEILGDLDSTEDEVVEETVEDEDTSPKAETKEDPSPEEPEESNIDIVVDSIKEVVDDVKDGVEELTDSVDEATEELLGIDLVKDDPLIKESILTDTFKDLESGFGEITLEFESESEPLKEENVDDIDATEDIQEFEKGTGNYELNTGVGVTTEYTGSQETSVKQLIKIDNPTDEGITTNLDITTELKLNPDSPIVYWDGEGYDITDKPTILQAYEKTESIPEYAEDIGEGDIEGLEGFKDLEHSYIAGTVLTFSTKTGGTGTYNWSDVSEMPHQVAIIEDGGKYILALTLYDLVVDSNSATVIDPTYDWSSSANYNQRFEGGMDESLRVGDVNGDGVGDLIMGLRGADYNGSNSGSVYVYFGGTRESGASKPVTTSTNYHVRFDGPAASMWFGEDNSIGVYDVNEDGDGDLVLGLWRDTYSGGTYNGSVFVIYSTLLDDFGGTGNNVQIDETDCAGATEYCYNIRYVGDDGWRIGEGNFNVGDANGDSDTDLLIGAAWSDIGSYTNNGSVLVILSSLISAQTGTGNLVDLTNANNYNIMYTGEDDYDYLSSDRQIYLEDLNNDGKDDLLLGTSSAEGNSGALWVIYSAMVNTYATTSPGTTYNLAAQSCGGDYCFNIQFHGDLGQSEDMTNTLGNGKPGRYRGNVAVGDLNQDGVNDLALGSFDANIGPGNDAGTVYIVYSEIMDSYGSSVGNVLDMSNSNNWNVRYDGGRQNDFIGDWAHLFIDDINSDGYGDLILAASDTTYVERWTTNGSVWLIYSEQFANHCSRGEVRSLGDPNNWNVRFEASDGYYAILGENNAMTIRDFNGDGFGDLVMPELWTQEVNSNGGAVYVVYSTLLDDYTGSNGNILQLKDSSSYNVRYDGDVNDDQFTNSEIEDIDDDGTFDMIAQGELATSGAYVVYNFPHTITASAGSSYTQDQNPIFTGTVTVDANALTSLTGVKWSDDRSDVDSWTSCTADDGTFDELIEDYTCTLPTGMTCGSHTSYIRAIDSNDSGTGYSEHGSDTYTITVGAAGCNAIPDDPTSLGPTNLVNGSTTSDQTPTLNFTTNDTDGSDQVKHQIQLSQYNNFCSPSVDYASGLGSQGASSFTVGQAAGGGSYTSGSENQFLGDGDFYWRVKTTDDNNEESSFTTANSGSVAFVEEANAPRITLTAVTPDPTTDDTPSLTGTATDSDGTISAIQYQVDGTGGSWSACTADDGTFDEASEAFTCTVSSALTDASHTIYVRGTDSSANTTVSGDESSDVIEVDTQLNTGAVFDMGSSADYNARYTGHGSGDLMGDKVITADVDGDGDNDLIFGSKYADRNGTNSGSVYIKFGAEVNGNLALSSSSNYDLRFDGPGASDYLDLAGVADVNNDGEDDLIVDAAYADPRGRSAAGSVWVILSTMIASLDTTPGSNNYILSEAEPCVSGCYYNIRYDGLGASEYINAYVNSDNSDVSGDNGDDLIIASPVTDYSFTDAGSGYVILSTLIDDDDGSSGVNYDLGVGTSYNVRFDGGSQDELITYEEEMRIGDVDADGYPDLILASYSASYDYFEAGSAYVIYSTRIDDETGTGNNLGLATSGNYNIRVDGDRHYARLGYWLNNLYVDDINGNGDNDFIIGSEEFVGGYGAVWVLLDSLIAGQTGTGNILPLNTSTSYNIRYEGNDTYQLTGFESGSVNMGDVNADGNKDLIIGAIDGYDQTNAYGSAWVMFSTLIDDVGTSTGNNYRLANDDSDCASDSCFSVRYTEKSTKSDLGYSIYVGSDIDHDGYGDLIINSPSDSSNGADVGSVYVMYARHLKRLGTTNGAVRSLAVPTYYDIRFDGPSSGTEFTSDNNISSGDMDNDTFADIFMSDTTSNGYTWVVYGFEPGQTATVGAATYEQQENPVITGTATIDSDSVMAIGGIDWSETNDPHDSTWSIADCTADDGTFDSTSEAYTCSLPSGMSLGAHTVYLRASTEAYTNPLPANYSSQGFTILPSSNNDPNDPTNLGGADKVDGSTISDTTPDLTFDITDPDVGNQVQYKIQVDNTVGFASPIIDYTSALGAQGSRSFTVGQAAGGGSYTTGTEGQTLTETEYYWQVKAIDDSAAESSYVAANSGAIAFIVDLTAPDITLEYPKQFVNDTKTTLKFKKSTDISSYSASLDIGRTKAYSVSGIPANGDGSSSSYTWRDDSNTKVVFTNEDTASTTDDEIQVYFKGLDTYPLPQGRHDWKVNAINTSSVEGEVSMPFYEDTTEPSTGSVAILTDTQISGITTDGVYSLDPDTDSKARNPQLSGKVKDHYVGGKHNYGDGTKDTFDKVSAGPKKIKLDIQKLKSGEDPDSDNPQYDHYLTDEYDLSGVEDIIGDRKESEFAITPSSALVNGYFKVNFTQTDYAENGGTFGPFYLDVNYQQFSGTPIPIQSPVPSPTPTPQPPPLPIITPTPSSSPSPVVEGTLQKYLDKLANNLELAVKRGKNILASFTEDPGKSVVKWAKAAYIHQINANKILEHAWVRNIPGKSKTRIFNVKVRYITETSAVVTWRTNHAATSYLIYGTSTTNYEDGRIDSLALFPSRKHSANLTELTPDTTYYFELFAQGRTEAHWGPGSFMTLAFVQPPLPSPSPEPTEPPLLPTESPSPEPTETPLPVSPTPTPTLTPTPTSIPSPTPTISPVPTSTAPPAPEDGEVEEIVFEDLPDEAPDEIVPFIVQDVRTTIQDNETVVGSGTAATVVTAGGAAVVTTSAVVTTVPIVKTSYAVYRSVRTVSTTTLGVVAAWSYITGFVTNTLAALGFAKKKKRKTMGIIFDTASGKPVPGVYVTFTTSSGNLKSTVSNDEGRYSISLEPDTYTINVNKDGYKLASENIISMYSEVYEELYTPDTKITVLPNQPSPFINLAIGIHPIAKSDTAQSISTIPQRLGNTLEKHFYLFSIASFIISGYAYLVNPILLNQIVFYLVIAVMVLQTVSMYIKNRTYGTITKKGKPLPQATVELYTTNKSGKEELYTSTLTNNKGKYQFRPENGDYTLKVKDTYRKTIHSQTVTVTNTKPWVGERVGV